MRIAFLAPLPPPRTGQSLCDEAALEGLRRRHDVVVVPTSKGVLDERFGPRAAAAQVARIVRAAVVVRRGRFDAVYHSPSQSRLGNLKDLVLLGVMGRRLRSRTVLHLHGGGFRGVVAEWAPTRALNRRWFGQVARAVVLGPSLAPQLDGVVPAERIVSVANFADDELFVPEERAGDAAARSPLVVVFLGSLFRSKGWPALVGAADELVDDDRFRFVIAGPAPTEEDRRDVEVAAARLGNLDAVGELSGDGRRDLLWSAAVVAAPTSYPWEGQPMIVLEAFAAGCAVAVTDHAGVRDVFVDGVNGALLADDRGSTLAAALRAWADDPAALAAIARTNRAAAEAFRRARFVDEVVAVVEAVLS